DMGLELDNAATAVQGFGQVGSELASLLYQTGCRVVAVSDVYGGIFDEKGLDIPALKDHVLKTGSVKDFPGTSAIGNDQVLEAEVDILIPAAVHDVIHAGNAADIKAGLIVEGANGPVTTEADRILMDKQITVIPDVVANSGGATVCHFERSQGLSDEYWDLERVNNTLRKRILAAYTDSRDRAREVNTPSIRFGAWIHALKKLEKAMTLRGWI
ncbi:MAG: Glu/Leu/Phe/Val family dehydrogenase, partial [Desulfosalsimonas sp.]